MTLYRRSKDLGTVVHSVNEAGGSVCVDIFQRPNGTFGFEEYRMDVETAEGWFPIGFFSDKIFNTQAQAIAGAEITVGWLNV